MSYIKLRSSTNLITANRWKPYDHVYDQMYTETDSCYSNTFKNTNPV